MPFDTTPLIAPASRPQSAAQLLSIPRPRVMRQISADGNPHGLAYLNNLSDTFREQQAELDNMRSSGIPSFRKQHPDWAKEEAFRRSIPSGVTLRPAASSVVAPLRPTPPTLRETPVTAQPVAVRSQPQQPAPVAIPPPPQIATNPTIPSLGQLDRRGYRAFNDPALLAKFRKMHGGAFDPKSRMDAAKMQEILLGSKTAAELICKVATDTPYPGMSAYAMQRYAPISKKRQLTPDEQYEIDERLRTIIPTIFENDGMQASKKINSPLLRTLAAGLTGGAVGTAAGFGIGGLVGASSGNTTVSDGAQTGATIGGLTGAGLLGLIGYLSKKQENENIIDGISRLPEGHTTIRDFNSDPVRQAELDREARIHAAMLMSGGYKTANVMGFFRGLGSRLKAPAYYTNYLKPRVGAAFDQAKAKFDLWKANRNPAPLSANPAAATDLANKADMAYGVHPRRVDWTKAFEELPKWQQQAHNAVFGRGGGITRPLAAAGTAAGLLGIDKGVDALGEYKDRMVRNEKLKFFQKAAPQIQQQVDRVMSDPMARLKMGLGMIFRPDSFKEQLYGGLNTAANQLL